MTGLVISVDDVAESFSEEETNTCKTNAAFTIIDVAAKSRIFGGEAGVVVVVRHVLVMAQCTRKVSERKF